MALEQSRATVNNPDTDPAIIAYLTRYINILLCAETESTVTEMVRDRLDRGVGDDAPVANFLKSMRRSAIRSAKYSEIADTLGLFGTSYKNQFQSEVSTNAKVGESGIQRLGISVGNRDKTAHDSQAQPDITFSELEDAYKVAEEIMQVVMNALTK